MIIQQLLNGCLNFFDINFGILLIKADRDAESMVFGAKLVKDSEYAILEGDGGDVKYYVRQGDKWRLDRNLTGKNVDEVTFVIINQFLFKS